MCYVLNCHLSFRVISHHTCSVLGGVSLFDSQPQAQVQDEEITEDDLRLIEERESSIRQLEVSTNGFKAQE